MQTNEEEENRAGVVMVLPVLIVLAFYSGSSAIQLSFSDSTKTSWIYTSGHMIFFIYLLAAIVLLSKLACQLTTN